MDVGKLLTDNTVQQQEAVIFIKGGEFLTSWATTNCQERQRCTFHHIHIIKFDCFYCRVSRPSLFIQRDHSDSHERCLYSRWLLLWDGRELQSEGFVNIINMKLKPAVRSIECPVISGVLVLLKPGTTSLALSTHCLPCKRGKIYRKFTAIYLKR